MIKESSLLNISCCGNIVIIDTEYVSDPENIDMPERVCQIIFLSSRDAHKSFLSSFEWNLPVTYLSNKCTPDYFRSMLIGAVNLLSRRVRCRVFYNPVSHNNLNEKELQVTKDLMLGKSTSKISKGLNVSYKTVLNYRNRLFYRSFEKLDVNAVRLFRLSILLSEKHSKNSLAPFDESEVSNCPAKKPHKFIIK